MPFHLYRSNRTEELVAALARIVRQPLSDPLAAERIVVQGRGMERWLSMRLADRLGVWANPDFPFPRRFVETAFAAVLGEDEGVSRAFEPEALQWSVAELLRTLERKPSFEEIRHYLADDESERKRLQLAERIARCFDEYVVYRPDVLLAWQKGAEGGWQAELWRALVQIHGERHLAFVAEQFLRQLPRRLGGSDLGERVAVFGISTLPPLYLRLLYALAEHIDVHFFLLSPSPEYWVAARSRRELLRERLRTPGNGADLHFEEGHPLLASLGRLGREFFDLLLAGGDYVDEGDELYVRPGESTMLRVLQSDILRFTDRGGAESEPLGIAADDASIRVHSCHGPMREVEVLHDQLLDLFRRDPSLEPRHVVVLAPSIAAYAPFIEAVFGARREPPIPYRIADRRVRATREAADAFLSLVDVLRGRLPASQVLDLLGYEPIRSRFEIAETDLDRIRLWVTRAGVRWGADAGHRQEQGQPPLSANTWRFGLERLLLGYSMIGEEHTLFGGVLPYDDVEGTETVLLGRLADFCESLFAARAHLQRPRRLEAWRDDLNDLLSQMLRQDERTVHEHLELRAAFAALTERAAAARFTGEVDLATVAEQIEAELERGASAEGFLGAGVTFCELVPMRSIPFRVVSLLGLNDADFPRIRRRTGFDLLAESPRRGDRSSRDDDRYLFLEALLSARDHLLISCVGQGIADNAEIPPSVAVSELLDSLERSFRRDGGGTVRDLVVVRHPLQPFSPAYFDGLDARLFSHVRAYCDGARTLTGRRGDVPPFVRGRLAEVEEETVDLEELARFFTHPARFFLQRRLGIFLGGDATPLEDRQPLELDNLERWEVGDHLLRGALAGDTLAAQRAPMHATGSLPPGTPGDLVYESIAAKVASLLASANALMDGAGEARRVEIDVPTAPRLTGIVEGVWRGGLLRVQYAKLAPKRELDLWIRHLALNAQGRRGPSALVARDKTIRFRAADEALALLQDLLAVYRLGRATPLPFFPSASCEYAAAVHRGEARDRALGRAENAYRAEGHNGVRGECFDAYVHQIYRVADPLAPSFRLPDAGDDAPTFHALALRVLGPMLAHREEVK